MSRVKAMESVGGTHHMANPASPASRANPGMVPMPAGKANSTMRVASNPMHLDMLARQERALIHSEIPHLVMDVAGDGEGQGEGDNASLDFKDLIVERATRNTEENVPDQSKRMPAANMEKVPLLRDIMMLIYSWTAFAFYLVFAVVLGFLLAILWGAVAGTLSFAITWCLRPYYKIVLLCVTEVVGPIWRIWYSTIMGPLYDSCGRVFANIRGRFAASTHTKAGLVGPPGGAKVGPSCKTVSALVAAGVFALGCFAFVAGVTVGGPAALLSQLMPLMSYSGGASMSQGVTHSIMPADSGHMWGRTCGGFAVNVGCDGYSSRSSCESSWGGQCRWSSSSSCCW